MDRLDMLSSAARRAQIVNRAFGSSMSPMEIDRTFADEDIDLLALLPQE